MNYVYATNTLQERFLERYLRNQPSDYAKESAANAARRLQGANELRWLETPRTVGVIGATSCQGLSNCLCMDSPLVGERLLRLQIALEQQLVADSVNSERSP